MQKAWIPMAKSLDISTKHWATHLRHKMSSFIHKMLFFDLQNTGSNSYKVGWIFCHAPRGFAPPQLIDVSLWFSPPSLSRGQNRVLIKMGHTINRSSLRLLRVDFRNPGPSIFPGQNLATSMLHYSWWSTGPFQAMFTAARLLVNCPSLLTIDD